MRRIVLHRHAQRYFQRMPGDRQAQMRAALQAVATLPDLASSPNIRPMSGDWVGCHRLRVGSYRVSMRVVPPELPEAPDGTLDILAIGPRGDIYK